MKLSHEKYGIVIDSGSSGSRIQIYKWKDPGIVKLNAKNKNELRVPPSILQEPNWTLKISPGISSYNTHINDLWKDHFQDLIKFAEKIVPYDKHRETPIFVLATAGMRLLPIEDKRSILSQICQDLQRKSRFFIPSCSDFVNIIDGETEGIYGWLSLNYLMGTMNRNEDEMDTKTIGFMDMGGASTQICFVPSSEEEREKHDEDLATVHLRTLEGRTLKWKVFTETWLGFGANEARKRYLNLLVDISSFQKSNIMINDPCMPKGSKIEHTYEGSRYEISGIGNYEMCMKTIYPLLMKTLPCKDEPCLFNGKHGPKLNFKEDRFVGISEYWYTANDIFHSGGEYNYKLFNEKVRDYCESEWSGILKQSEEGKFSSLDPDTYLKDACFKASWVINILHEGFELPRLGLEASGEESSEETEDMRKISKVHVPFKSANSINGEELSWTLGKILLFASSNISPLDGSDGEVGIQPSDISSKLILEPEVYYIKEDYNKREYSILWLLTLSLFLLILLRILKRHFNKWLGIIGKFDSLLDHYFKIASSRVRSSDPKGLMRWVFGNSNSGSDSRRLSDSLLEEGNRMVLPYAEYNSKSTVLRTRSNINLTEDSITPQKLDSRSYANFMSKPFTVPNRSASWNGAQNKDG